MAVNTPLSGSELQRWSQHHRALKEAGLIPLGEYFVRETGMPTIRYLMSEGPVLVEWDVKSFFEGKGFFFDDDVDNRSNYNPDELVERLSRYGGRATLEKADLKTLQYAQRVAWSVFAGKGDITPHALDEGLRSAIKGEKNAGLPTFQKKRDSFLTDIKRAQRIRDGNKRPPPCIGFHRVQFGEKAPKTRLVWGYPGSMTLLEARFATKLIDRFKTRRSPMALGMVNHQIGGALLPITNSTYRYSLDFSGFDATVGVSLIRFAFRVLRSHFGDFTDEEQASWDEVVRYFINTPIMLPDRSVWKKSQGVPSGSFFTQMVDSVVNFVSVIYAYTLTWGCGPQAGRVLVLGDDAAVGAREYRPLEKLAARFRELGLVLNVDKTEMTMIGDGDVHFLGHSWNCGLPDRPIRELVQRLIYSEKPSLELKDRDERVAVKVLFLAFDAWCGTQLVNWMTPFDTPDVPMRYVGMARVGDLLQREEERFRTGVLPGRVERQIDDGLTIPPDLGTQAWVWPFVGVAV